MKKKTLSKQHKKSPLSIMEKEYKLFNAFAVIKLILW